MTAKTSPAPTIRVVDIATGPGVTWPILAAADPWAGVAVANIHADTTTEHQLIRDLLDGLGKRSTVSGWDRSVDNDREVLPIWLAAHPITDLVVVGSQDIPTYLLDVVAGACAVAGTNLWLCEEHPGVDYLAERANWPTGTATFDELLAALPDPPADAPAAFPDVPLDGPMTFLAACRDELPDDEFAVVAARYREVRDATRGWAAARDVLDENSVVEWLRGQMDRCRTVPEMLTVVRAVQVEAFQLDGQRYHVQVELLRLLATADHAPEAVAADPATWRALAAYRDPVRGAACALAAAGAGIDDLTALRLADIGEHGTGITTADGTTIHVHPDAAVYLRAQHLVRVAQGAGDDELVFADEDGPHRNRLLVRYIRNPVTDLGIAVTTRAVTNARPDAARWSSRWGVSVQAL